MKRRDFLKLSPAVSLPFLLNGLPLQAASRHPLLQVLQAQTIQNGRVLVMVQLNGGNDGLNTLIPLDQYSNLVKARSNIIIPYNRALTLAGVPQTGFHPSMAAMQNMYNNGQMNIVQAVSYPNPNYSHFRATDIWLTGSDADTVLGTGWLGRTFETNYAGYPVNYPNADMPDPLAIQIGSQASLVTQCTAINPAVTVTDPNSFYQLINGVAGTVPNTPYGHELSFVRLIKQQTSAYTTVIKNAYNASGSNTVSYPSGNPLADQLKIVARLIKGGLKTPVYVVNHPDTFDTHAHQVDIADSTMGTHANMLSALSQAVNAFQQDLVNMQVSDRVATMTITEFGRRIKSNDSLGCDHGAASPVFFFGTNLNPIIVGSNPQIPDNTTSSDQVTMQNDFRAVYYTVLKDWFQLSPQQMANVFPGSYTTLPIFRQVALPVTLLSFTGSWNNNKVQLQWDVDRESNIDHYEVQRSVNGTDFIRTGSVNAINSPVQHRYGYTDQSLSQSFYYYRIKTVEASGTITFSNIILLKTGQPGIPQTKIYPNPVSDHFTVSFESKVSGLMNIRLTDLEGREVWKDERELSGAYNQHFSFGGKKPAAGIYTVKLQVKNEETTARIVIR